MGRSLGHAQHMGQSRTPFKTEADAPGVAARRAALRLLDAVLRRGQPLESALHGATQGLKDRADRSLVHAIVAETLRRIPDLDALIDGATQKPLPDDAKARMVLRLALAQHLVLGTPDHAVIATALPLMEGGPRRLVHGVLGTLFRSGAALPDVPTLPADVAARWEAAWGGEAVEAAGKALAQRAAIDISLADPTETAAWAERMGGHSLAPGHVRLAADTDVASLPGYADGGWWVQDLAASIPARLLGPGEGRTVIDACAAPGGKTMQLAAAGWSVTALDQSRARIDRMADNLARTRLAVETVVSDARQWNPSEPVDAVLLDAPCSATGIFRRHPDVLHRVGGRQIAELAELQAVLLDHVVSWLKPGGQLVYSTCSLEPAEGEAQVERLVATHPQMTRLPIRVDQLPEGLAPAPDGTVRTGPWTLADQGGVDGFFVVMLERRA